MLRLNRMTDYGVVVLAQLAETAPAVQTASEIAAVTRLSRPTVAKLLRKLARGDLVESHRGAHGGYSLARPAREVTVAKAIEAIEGPAALTLTPCVEGDADACDREGLCPMFGRWNKVNAAIRAGLEGITLADMISPLVFFDRPLDERRHQHDNDAALTA